MSNVNILSCVNNLFEQPWWLDIVAENCWNEIVVEENGEVIGRLPFYCKEDKREILMPPLTQTCGLWIKSMEQTSGNEHLSKKKKIIDEILGKLPKHTQMKISIDSSCDYILPFLWKGFTVIPKVSYRIEELVDLDAVYGNFSKTVKKNIKSAQKKVVIKQEADAGVILELLDKTFAAQGRKDPISHELVKRIIATCEERGNGKMYTAIDEQGNVHASSYFVYDENVFYYLLAGSDVEFRSSGAQTLILWEAIQYASKVSKCFDFEGSMIEGIETFFKRFGGKPIMYYEIKQLSLWGEVKELMKPRIKKILGYKS